MKYQTVMEELEDLKVVRNASLERLPAGLRWSVEADGLRWRRRAVDCEFAMEAASSATVVRCPPAIASCFLCSASLPRYCPIAHQSPDRRLAVLPICRSRHQSALLRFTLSRRQSALSNRLHPQISGSPPNPVRQLNTKARRNYIDVSVAQVVATSCDRVNPVNSSEKPGSKVGSVGGRGPELITYDDVASSTSKREVDSCEKDNGKADDAKGCCYPEGHHCILDEQIGVLCKHCLVVFMEMKHIYPDFVTKDMTGDSFLGGLEHPDDAEFELGNVPVNNFGRDGVGSKTKTSLLKDNLWIFRGGCVRAVPVLIPS
nr:SNF2 domain-containing protein CLASSY 3-like [Ipomoea batatas]